MATKLNNTAQSAVFTPDDLNAAKKNGLTLLSLDETSPFYIEPALRKVIAIFSNYSMIVLHTEQHNLIISDVKNRARNAGIRQLNISTSDEATLSAIYKQLPHNSSTKFDVDDATSPGDRRHQQLTGAEKLTIAILAVTIGIFAIGLFSHNDLTSVKSKTSVQETIGDYAAHTTEERLNYAKAITKLLRENHPDLKSKDMFGCLEGWALKDDLTDLKEAAAMCANIVDP